MQPLLRGLSVEWWVFSGLAGILLDASLRRLFRSFGKRRKVIVYKSPEAFIEKLCENYIFSKFKKKVQEGLFKPLTYDRLLMESERWYRSHPFEKSVNEYALKYLSWIAIETLSREEIARLQSSLRNFTLNQYLSALHIKASRLKCHVSEVRPISPVLPLRSRANAKFKLVNLPQDIFIRIINRLDTIDVFRFTLVCKKWKRVVYDNPTELRRAEHDFITHSISFTNWLDCPENALGFPSNPRLEEYSWCLFNWYCGVSQNLETLILDGDFPYADVMHLLHLCPRLKNLEIQRSTSFQTPKVPLSNKQLQLPNLEVFCHSFSIMDPITELNRNVLVSSDCLKAFRGILCLEDIYFIERHKPIENIFEKLIALDIGFYEVEVLETLLGVDNWQLKYLKIDGQRAKYSVESNRVRARDAIDKLLPKLKKLEIWIGSQWLGTSNRTVKLMTNLNLNLRFVVFYRTGYVLTAGDGEEPLDSQTLSTFSNRLRSRCSDLDLSESQLIMYESDSQKKAFQEADTGFTLVRRPKDSNIIHCDYPLNEQTIKRYLSLNF